MWYWQYAVNSVMPDWGGRAINEVTLSAEMLSSGCFEMIITPALQQCIHTVKSAM